MTQVYCELTEYSANRLKLPRYVYYNTNKTLKINGSHMYILQQTEYGYKMKLLLDLIHINGNL